MLPVKLLLYITDENEVSVIPPVVGDSSVRRGPPLSLKVRVLISLEAQGIP